METVTQADMCIKNSDNLTFVARNLAGSRLTRRTKRTESLASSSSKASQLDVVLSGNRYLCCVIDEPIHKSPTRSVAWKSNVHRCEQKRFVTTGRCVVQRVRCELTYVKKKKKKKCTIAKCPVGYRHALDAVPLLSYIMQTAD